jgi:hypothetical protein
MVAALRTPRTLRPALPEDGPLMALCRVPDAMRLLLGGGSEDSDQRNLAKQLDARDLLWNHCPNEAERSESERGSALAKGLKKGVPDVMIYDPFVWQGKHFSGLAIELKRSDCTPTDVSDDQRRWLHGLRARGWMAEWCRGFGEAERLVRRAYGGG